MKKIVNAFMSNKIYLANIKKDGTMSDTGREDVTQDVIIATIQHMEKKFKSEGKSRYVIDGVGEIKFTPQEK